MISNKAREILKNRKEREKQLEDLRYKNATAFLQKCSSDGASIGEVFETIELIKSMILNQTSLDKGFNEPMQKPNL